MKFATLTLSMLFALAACKKEEGAAPADAPPPADAPAEGQPANNEMPQDSSHGQ